MNRMLETVKLAGDKIALLGLLLAGLLVARVMVASRSSIILSKPIELAHTGLRISIPAGNGWESSLKWEYKRDAFLISSAFSSVSGKATAWAQCRYLLAADISDPNAQFEQRAADIQGRIVETGLIAAGNLTIDWVKLKKPRTPLNILFGTTKLPDGRLLEIEVNDIAGEPELARKTFRKIAASLSFEDAQLLATGAQVVAEVKDLGLSSFMGDQNEQTYFLIKDASQRPVGFTIFVLIDYPQEAPLDIQGAAFAYIKGPRTQERATSFRSDNRFDQFSWGNEVTSGRRRSRVEVVLDQGGYARVRKSGDDTEGTAYLLGPAAVPRILLAHFIDRMVESGRVELIVDLIEADGAINPVLLSRVEDGDANAEDENLCVLELEPLDSQGVSERIYVDSGRQISRRIAMGNTAYNFERSDLDTVVALFPERARDVLRKVPGRE